MLAYVYGSYETSTEGSFNSKVLFEITMPVAGIGLSSSSSPSMQIGLFMTVPSVLPS